MTTQTKTLPESEDVQRASLWVADPRASLADVIVGQNDLVQGLLVGLLTDTRYDFTYYRDPSGTFCAAPVGGPFNATNAFAIVW